MLLTLAILIPSWNLHTLDPCSAKTIVRLWHDLHEVHQREHNFMDMTSPKSYDAYFAIVRHEEIKAIAACKRSSKLQIHRVAYRHDSVDASIYLMSHLKAANICSCTDSFKKTQSKLYLEWLVVESLS